MPIVQGVRIRAAPQEEGRFGAQRPPRKRIKSMPCLKQCAIVIVGASGDLAKHKLIPALNALHLDGRLDDSNVVIGAGRTSFSESDFRKRFDIADRFAARLYYHQRIQGLKRFLASLGDFPRVIFFLAQPPAAYAGTARELRAEGFGIEASLIIEKPFGYDYASARTLDRELSAEFDESQLFRIDHYLGKEAVQNILVFRFANAIFYPVWNSRYIESIQISALEDIGIMERGSYFDKAGIIRDMVQNHLLQLLSLIAMEAPVSLDADDIRRQKINLLRTISVAECFRSQYHGYEKEKGVAPGSTTETYAELKLYLNNFRWAGMPVYIRTGKAVHRRSTEIGVRFKKLPRLLFNERGEIAPNQIVFKIQPAEGIILDVSSKIPGTDDAVSPTHMDFCYRQSFSAALPEAYQRLLFDAIKGDRTLFVSAEETETAWKILDPFLDKGPLGFYNRGSLPTSKLDVDWIDFDKHATLCK
jgi:glucose-6-phosphate 1-dehydrogenase